MLVLLRGLQMSRISDLDHLACIKYTQCMLTRSCMGGNVVFRIVSCALFIGMYA